MEMAAATVTSWPASKDRENEDSTANTPQVAVVVDGAGIPASLRSGCSHSVAWYSQALATTFQVHLADPRVRMRDALRSAIAEVVARHEDTCDLAAGSPSATVAAWRITGSDLEYLVLCDSSLFLSFTDGRNLEVTDDRLGQVIAPWVEAATAQPAPGGLSISRDELHAASRQAVELLRNTAEGFWCCHNDPAAADEALQGSIPLAALRGAVLATDGATRGIHLLGTHTLEETIEAALSGTPDELLRQIRAAEDAQAQSLTLHAVKVHDDATLVSVKFREPVQQLTATHPHPAALS
jgi:hypothetical protein